MSGYMTFKAQSKMGPHQQKTRSQSVQIFYYRKGRVKADYVNVRIKGKQPKQETGV